MADPPPSLAPPSQPVHSPRVILYAQTHHLPDGEPVSLLPLLTHNTGVTHVIVAAVHLNDGARLTLNDDPDTAPKFGQLWNEVAILQASGVPVLALLGGAARGSFERLGGSDAQFETTYAPLASFLHRHRISGIDLDVEEPVPLRSIVRLIDRLRLDFGASFFITLAPVLPALIPEQRHLSGFNYFSLHELRGDQIAWYNVQFYCGWGDAGSTQHYEMVLAAGWDPRRVVLGVVTCPDNGAGFVPAHVLREVVGGLRARCLGFGASGEEGFGGVMGWEYFNGVAPNGDRGRPWEWAGAIGAMVRAQLPTRSGGSARVGRGVPGLFGGQQGALDMGETQHAFPAESVKTLKDLGFNHQQVIAALNMTGGNVEYAAGILFES